MVEYLENVDIFHCLTTVNILVYIIHASFGGIILYIFTEI